MLPPARASGAARATERSACANRLLRARGASRRSTAVRANGCRPPPAGTALAPPAGVSGRRLLSERDSGFVTELETDVKGNVAKTETKEAKKLDNFAESILTLIFAKLHQSLQWSFRHIAAKEGEMLDKSTTMAASNKSEKREKFVKLAENRTRNAIKAIRVIGKLGNKNAYQFDDSDVQKIVRALNKEIDSLKARMTQASGKETVDFEL
jgi:hypothetical protein